MTPSLWEFVIVRSRAISSAERSTSPATPAKREQGVAVAVVPLLATEPALDLQALALDQRNAVGTRRIGVPVGHDLGVLDAEQGVR